MPAHSPDSTIFGRQLYRNPHTGLYFYDELQVSGCEPVSPLDLPAGTPIQTGRAWSSVLPDFDFETYSEAGYQWHDDLQKWKPITSSPPHGLPAVGAHVYVEHPSFDLLSLCYDLKDGQGARLWYPELPEPTDLFEHIRRGGLIEAWNSGFEWHVWTYYCRRVLGWPALPYWQTRDAMVKARAWGLPGKLEKAGEALRTDIQKDKDGTRLLNKFSKPRNPTKKDARTRIRPNEDPVDGPKLYAYNCTDIQAEASISAQCPDLLPNELDLWLTDQRINFRGVHIDRGALEDCKAIIEQATARYTEELAHITGGACTSAMQTERIRGWLAGRGCHMASIDEDHVNDALAIDNLDPQARRVLEIRQVVGSASVKKVYAIDRRLPSDNRLKELFAFCGADRTGRWAGRGPQPQNLPNSGPKVELCDGCGHYSVAGSEDCTYCGAHGGMALGGAEWGPEAVEDALEAISTRSLDYVEHRFGNAVAAVSGCLRGLFSASPGHDLICSDYSAIEAVVLAALAGEEWRLEVFRTHGMIYEASASQITGVPLEEFAEHKKSTGEHHPLRKKIGKVAELASGYQGAVGAWKAFGADEFFDTDDEILDKVKAWRAASPRIVDLWYGLERAAKAAVQDPGRCYSYNGMTYGVKGDVLYCRLLSGRFLAYHRPRLKQDVTPWGREVMKLTFEGWNSDYKKGPIGWQRMDTYGGKLAENVTQAHARDILAHGLQGVERAGYSVVLHVHDEVASEVVEGTGSVEEFESILATMPDWCRDWPVKAAGGWRRKRYGKD